MRYKAQKQCYVYQYILISDFSLGNIIIRLTADSSTSLARMSHSVNSALGSVGLAPP